ncbi:IclR family transcriptional regulator [Variovorax sp. PBL-E5]|uniref:IclR family transcriptional regulator n=1 Tax=Variovorax sp. PBL-E5 TaxID=434014 RepID=UPI0013169750|nr:IclR family transcriptional regulator [Variovorax sp. PBL-E5]VTU37797.1 Pca regulon regulatory protein [Variovorax sp. PBL-E5]
MKKPPDAAQDRERADPLLVQSVLKAFAVLHAFDASNRSLGLAQIAAIDDMGKSAAQRFTHTLMLAGYLAKDPQTKRFELTARTLTLGSQYIQTHPLVSRATPYLQQLSNSTRETVNLTLRDDLDIVFAARFPSQHVLNTDVVVGTRLPVFCTAPGIAMLSRLPRAEAMSLLRRSDRRAFTANTTRELGALERKLDRAARMGYATAWEEFYPGDLSIAAPVLDAAQRPVGAINVSVTRAMYTPDDAEAAFHSLVVATAHSVSG